ncbi:MAG: lipoyl(octanoyl) transferase LipB [Thaumarchaeota archaeon]|nr:lipoyl(octanoyl) transferase LipB [Candidatus Calditenuaceae archaeon]MDW8186576.1 lipoyl(octanoyl) transferase LipB [Nitrososphaerota archaeon]
MRKGLELLFCDLNRTNYDECHDLMLRLVELRSSGAIGDVVLLTEHGHVYTLGRHAKPEQVTNRSVPIRAVERAGGPTYHGPGQLVAYPIIRLSDREIGAADLVRLVEASVVSVLRRLGLQSEAGSPIGRAGVWVNGRKIASIGMAVRGGVSFHGVALNVSVELAMFYGIMPCGMSPDLMTSIERELGRSVDMNDVKRLFVREFSEALAAVPIEVQGRYLSTWTKLTGSTERTPSDGTDIGSSPNVRMSS